MSRFVADAVLKQLDAADDAGNFPYLQAINFGTAGLRISAFTNRSDWSLFIEKAAINFSDDGMHGFINSVYRYGSLVQGEKGLNRDRFIFVGEPGPYSPEFEHRDHRGWPIFAVRPGVKSLVLRGREIEVPESAEALEAAGIEVMLPPDIDAQELLEWVAKAHPELVFETDETLREQTGKPLPLVLRLREWYHDESLRPVPPSEMATFQQIAQVIETGNPNLYQPAELPNTDWRNWKI